ncbi:MAG: hypothetical protein IPJ78_18075 [Gemmatimonadetes bacterium]|nr:hypothetical protein [Gemmatimonadota bacterium]
MLDDLARAGRRQRLALGRRAISRCTSFMFFLNSLMPLPNEPAISGMRFAPKSSSTTTSRMIISVGPMPNILPP